MENDFKDADDNTVPKQSRVWEDEPQPSSAATWPAMTPVSLQATQQAPRVNGALYTGGGADTPLPPPTPARESAARQRLRRRKLKSRRASADWAWVVVAAALLGVVVISSMSVFLALSASQAESVVLPTAAAALPTPVDARADFSGANGGFREGQPITLVDGRSIVLEPWDGRSRFSVLVMGLDRRPGETGLAFRTDTMMIVSIDPNSRRVGVLSVPRDLFVDVPGYGQLQRINTPMVLGELQQTGFGPQLAMQTMQLNLGMRIHDYVAVDFNAFIALVDAIGGVEVDVPVAINDPQYPDMFYGYDPFFISAGHHQLDGLTALKYARTRHSSSDFERAERQQQVLFAVRERLLDLNMLPQLIIQAPRMWSQLSDNIYTGLSLDQIIQLAWFLKDVPPENIRTGVIDSRYTFNYQTSGGAQVLVPDRARLGPLLVDVFGANYSE